MDPFVLTPPAAFPLANMFGTVPENNVTFCVDTSGSMYNGLDCVKEQLMEMLMRRAYEMRPESTFNILEFNSNVTQWADRMVKCTPETVKVAAEWVSTLEAKTGTNTQNALLAALSDPDCEAVYLVTDSLPDQQSEDVLDHIGYAGQGRPVHCIYLAKGTPDHATVKFLRTLAEETYGFFNVVTLTMHGCMEKVMPIIRMDSINSHVMKTSNGNIYPKQKTCSVSATLQSDPEEALIQMHTLLPWGPLDPYGYNWLRHPYLGYGWQSHCAWPFQYPLTEWSRYRPARSWLKAQQEMLDEFDNPEQSPAAGSLIINKPVLARRLHDGYFYQATVQSQILENKFVVAFGPCKHGKYTETTYEETWVHDIISYNDAKRHAIVTGDKVLAPWEPDGERFCPGTIIDGQETREAKGPASDHQITVTFANGHTETVPLDKAVWIPPTFSDRLALELQMPCEARKSLECQTNYPEDSLPGYPVSGPVRRPKEFCRPHHVGFLHNSPAVMAGLYRYPDYIPVYPVIHTGSQYNSSPCAVTSESMNTIIPGTEMTKQDLSDKVMSQLSEHRHKLREYNYNQAANRPSGSTSYTHINPSNESYPMYAHSSSNLSYHDRLLDKREKLSENSFRKSVSWKDSRSSPRNDCYSTDDEFEDQDADSGVSVSPDLLDRWELSSPPSSHSYYDELRSRSADAHSDTMPSRGYWSYPKRRSPRNSGHRKTSPAWKGSQRFRETAMQAPLEVRAQKLASADVEWPCSHFKYVDTFAKHDRPYTVKDLMNVPRPPMNEAQASMNKDDVSVLSQQAQHELKEKRILEFKKKRTFQRDANRQQLQDEHDIQTQRSLAKHRREVQNRSNKSQQTEFQNEADMTQMLETKRHASTQLREQWVDKKVQPFDREQRRIGALKEKREKREAEQAETMREKEELAQSREECKRVRSQERWNQVNQRLDEQEAAITNQMQHCRVTSDLTAQRFHTKEAQAQELKDRRIGVTGQQLAIYRSQVLP